MSRAICLQLRISALILTVLSVTCSATVLDFETLTGPSLFGPPPQTLNIATSIGTVTVSGGLVLTEETNLPADQSSVYGTSAFDDVDTDYSNPITIVFPQPITNFFLNVYNGNTEPIDYTIADNAGHTATFNLTDNFSGGQSLVGFAATGTVVTITAGRSPNAVRWDFSVDNVTFNEPLPATLAPEPSTIGFVGCGLVGVGLVTLKRRRLASAAGAQVSDAGPANRRE